MRLKLGRYKTKHTKLQATYMKHNGIKAVALWILTEHVGVAPPKECFQYFKIADKTV